MPLGDSITGSPGCWRAKLWNCLQSSGHTSVDFVGTLGDPGWLAATRPGVVMMHLGTNDVWNNIAPSTILAAFSKLVGDRRRGRAPTARPPRDGVAPNGYPYCVNGSASDPDGDGWGWENNASCVVRGSAADH